MLQLVYFCVPPTLAFLLAGRNRKTKRPAVFAWAEWMAYAVTIILVTMIIFIPFQRVSWHVTWDSKPYLAYGTLAAVFAVGLGVFFGEASHRLKQRLGIGVSVAEGRQGRRCWTQIAVHLPLFVLIFLSSSYHWALSNYGNISFEEMIFHINMPLRGTANSFIEDFTLNAALPAVVIFAAAQVLCRFPSGRVYRVTAEKRPDLNMQVFPVRLPALLATAGMLLWFGALFVSADQSFFISGFFLNQLRQSSLIEEEYVDPGTVALRFPEQKRNLIWVYIESGETSSQDVANGGFFEDNYIPEMTQIAKANVSFSQSELIEGAAVAPACGWTIAGLVAQTAGLPLKLYTQEDGISGVDNSMSLYEAFMPGATALGDILEEAGYHNVFLAGSDFEFGGRSQFFTQHGGYEILDYCYAVDEGIIEPDYYVNWGFEDQKLYALAKETLLKLAQDDQPFQLSLLTVDTHTPEGYICPLCPDTYDNEFANVLACSSKQVSDFIEWCSEQPFYENTTIVVTGDHSSMVSGFYGEHEYNKYGGETERKVYNAFIHAVVEPAQEKNRRFTTLDFFPTALASIGVEIEGNRLGLGTNLFSERETLAEEYGYDRLFEELGRKSVFYNEKILFPSLTGQTR
ncbi:MAG: sulfatase-like hydrolase/transferase [Clostridia bacterium]|nr:sulfatase-like hydrolase/transferase [Clostridia bacterium]